MLYTGKETMPDYANGKIYKIVGEDGATYYGSTVQSLNRRLSNHVSKKERHVYQEIISQMNWEMILVENYPCESKKELELHEGWYIRENPCINRRVEGRTDQEYREDNRVRIMAKIKKWYEENREKRRVYDTWIRSFGDPRYTNCLQRCDSSLFA